MTDGSLLAPDGGSDVIAQADTRAEVARSRPIYEQLAPERRQRLVGPEDDMWATFADRADPYAIHVDGAAAGCCSMDESQQLYGFHVRPDHEESAGELLAHVMERLAVTACVASTVDPFFLGLSLEAGARPDTVALMYERIAAPGDLARVHLRRATTADHAAAVAHNRAATGADSSFLEPYLTGVIDRQELYLVEADGRIVATGECRVDHRSRGYAHLGFVVEVGSRSQGLGTRLLQTLVATSIAAGLVPVCSTEPDNLAARRAIHRSGFRSRHRVFRLTAPGR